MPSIGNDSDDQGRHESPRVSQIDDLILKIADEPNQDEIFLDGNEAGAAVRDELPDTIFVLKDSSLNFVKDVCTDDPSNGKVMEEYDQFGHDRVIDVHCSNLAELSDLAKYLPCPDDGKFVDTSNEEFERHMRSEDLHDESAVETRATCDIVNDVSENSVAENLFTINGTGFASQVSPSSDLDGQVIANGGDNRLPINLGMSPVPDEKHETVAVAVANLTMFEKEVDDSADLLVENAKPRKSISLQEQDLERQHPCPSEIARVDQQQSDQRHSSDMGVDMESLQSHVNEGVGLTTTANTSAHEGFLDCNRTGDFTFDKMMEIENITFEFNSTSSSSMSARVDSIEDENHQNTSWSFSLSGIKSESLDNLTNLTSNFYVQHNCGDSDISGPTFDPITHSGPLSFSGNISVQSESSRASAHSFAFPIVHSEWNSSPMKMPAADQRQLKAHRCWKIPIFCCKF